ncbi:MAG: hypothetical protein JO131_00500, partial [Gammaproteobacteria bacterium]|nr:hypothetical protein [Gammaproteobacteria bacterium]
VNKIFQMQTPEQLQELKKELQLTPEILKFMELCIGEKVKQDNDSTDAAANKNAFVGLYSADGTLIENMGLFATSDAASAKIQTVEGLLRISGIAEMLNTDIKNDILSLETSPTLKLY